MQLETGTRLRVKKTLWDSDEEVALMVEGQSARVVTSMPYRNVSSPIPTGKVYWIRMDDDEMVSFLDTEIADTFEIIE